MVLSSLGAVAEATSVEELSDAVLVAAVAVVGADSAVVTAVGPSGPTVRTWPEGFLSAEQLRTFERVNRTHPWPLATHTRSRSAVALRLSDLFSQQDFRRLDIYGELFCQLSFDHQVAFSVSTDPERPLCVAVNRKGKDFTADDLDRIEALRRPLTAAASRVNTRERRARPGNRWDARSVGLSARETEVLSLVASGLTNDQIGRRLGISARTVNKHLEHVFAKTGMRNRTQLAARWHDQSTWAP